MTYLATLYSATLDRFEVDCNSAIYWEGDLAEWLAALPDYYNNKDNMVTDFVIVSVVRIGEL
jgi:hypothetical protein